ncbi:hypothetical protein PSN45_001553 [Yamadazyma tenuis]|uniref:uncharacterized protein n=1 Tax=Candida tenuis TaxID=2315449 RepID=UPI00279F8C8F|nr:hypothetical protein PSN45_001553 [Yamadazyma tenuis]
MHLHNVSWLLLSLFAVATADKIKTTNDTLLNANSVKANFAATENQTQVPPLSWKELITSFFHDPKPVTKRHYILDSHFNQVKYFQTMDDFITSTYFKNPKRPDQVYAKINETESNSLFSVVSYPTEKKTGNIIVREVYYGEPKSASILNQPITKCAYSHSPLASVQIRKSNSFSRAFEHVHGFQVSASYSLNIMDVLTAGLSSIIDNVLPGLANLTIGLGVSSEIGKSYSTSRSFGGTVNCGSGTSDSTQLFVSIRYVYYPNAKVRYRVYRTKGRFSGSSAKFVEASPWEKAYSSESHSEYGVVVYDNSHGTEYACVNDPKYLQCDDEVNFKVFDPQYDPVEGLHYALQV